MKRLVQWYWSLATMSWMCPGGAEWRGSSQSSQSSESSDIKTRVSSDVRFDVWLWIVCQQAGGVGVWWTIVTCHELSWLSHTSLHHWTIFRVTGAEDRSSAGSLNCSSYVLFSFRVVYYSVVAITGLGGNKREGIIPFWKNYVPELCHWTIQYWTLCISRYMAQTCLALVRANPF